MARQRLGDGGLGEIGKGLAHAPTLNLTRHTAGDRTAVRLVAQGAAVRFLRHRDDVLDCGRHHDLDFHCREHLGRLSFNTWQTPRRPWRLRPCA
jgi:hypothetical protein